MRCTNLHFDGLTDETINQGADFDALEGVKAYDADGNEVDFSVEPEEFDSCVVGEQTLVYKAMGKDNRLIPSMCIPKDSNGANLPLGCTLTLLKENRKITVLQADPPRFTMNDVTIPKNTTLDVLDGVTAVDDNGNPITDITYSGTLDKEASGDIVSIDDGDERYPVKSLKVTLEPIQSGSGTPSPDNVRPISGHTEVVTEVCGKNLLDVDDFISGVNCGSDYFAGGRNAVTFDKQGTYTIKANTPSAGYLYARIKNADGTFGAFQPIIQSTTYTTRTLTVTDGQTLLLFDAISNTLATTKSNVSDWSVQVEAGSSATDYEPYQGNPYTTDLGRTVYGADVEQVGGQLTDKMGMVTLNGSDHTFFNEVSQTTTADGTCYVAYINNARSGIKVGGLALANSYEWVDAPTTALHKGQFNTGGSYTRFVIADQTLDTLAKWDAWLASNPMQLCYELATPQTYQLTPQTISLLHGNNNVWSDGEVEMVYSVELPTDGEVSYPLEGEYEITYSATDKCGNVGEAIRHITVQ